MERKFTGERLESNIYNENTIKHLHRYAIVSNYIKNKVVLDIASGEGYGSNLMSQHASSVYGVDIDAQSITHAKKRYRKNNLSFHVGSTSNIPLEDNSIDVVVSFETIEHHDEHEQMFKEIKRVLKANGILIISSPDKYFYSDLPNYKNKFHVKELYKEDFIALISEFFSHYQILTQSYLNRNSIMLDNHTREVTNFYSGDFLKLMEVPSHPEFLIAIASNYKFEKLYNSVFEGEPILKSNENQIVKQIHNSTTYKVGNIVLFPFKLIKRTLNRLKSRKP